jgi:hypothetical protein
MTEGLEKNRRFLLQVEQTIRLANNEVIHQQISPVTSDRMLSFAVTLAKLRAEYIKAAFDFADAKHEEGAGIESEINELCLLRKKFEEVRCAFLAIQRGIELGYVMTE